MDSPTTWRGILACSFSVRGYLEGRKTQTRRLITVPWKNGRRCPPYEPYYIEKDGHLLALDEHGDYHRAEDWICPYRVGWGLYVREAHKKPLTEHAYGDGPHGGPDDPCYGYRADMTYSCGKPVPEGGHKWKPCIHMPKVASRIALRVTGIRAERVQEISNDDARAEGIQRDILPVCGDHPDLECWVTGPIPAHAHVTPKEAFADLWDTLHPKEGNWEANPWVWVYETETLAVGHAATQEEMATKETGK